MKNIKKEVDDFMYRLSLQPTKRYFVTYKQHGHLKIVRDYNGEKYNHIANILLCRDVVDVELVSFGTGVWEDE